MTLCWRYVFGIWLTLEDCLAVMMSQDMKKHEMMMRIEHGLQA
jgi:hypothetical protein